MCWFNCSHNSYCWELIRFSYTNIGGYFVGKNWSGKLWFISIGYGKVYYRTQLGKVILQFSIAKETLGMVFLFISGMRTLSLSMVFTDLCSYQSFPRSFFLLHSLLRSTSIFMNASTKYFSDKKLSHISSIRTAYVTLKQFIGLTFICNGGARDLSCFPSSWTTSRKSGKYTVFHWYEFSCESLNWVFLRTLSDILHRYTWKVESRNGDGDVPWDDSSLKSFYRIPHMSNGTFI